MKRKYRFHPEEYEIGETEQFYESMAAKGWLLERRGTWLSRFRKAAPQRRRYRVEVASGSEGSLPEDQVALYQESGWELAAQCGVFAVFSAPECCAVPELYTDAASQAPMLHTLWRRYTVGALAETVAAAALLLAWVAFSRNNPLAEFLYAFFFAPSALLSVLLFFVWSVFSQCAGAVACRRLYRSLRRGIPLSHQKQARHPARAVRRALGGVLCLSLLLTVGQLASTHERPLPQQADGPYLLLEDLGFTGVRGVDFLGNESELETGRSALLSYWHAYEFQEDGSGGIWMYQDCYELPNGSAARLFARVLMARSLLHGGESGFSSCEIPGLDLAYDSPLEHLAVKGNRVILITTGIDHLKGSGSSPSPTLVAIAEKWSGEGAAA